MVASRFKSGTENKLFLTNVASKFLRPSHLPYKLYPRKIGGLGTHCLHPWHMIATACVRLVSPRASSLRSTANSSSMYLNFAEAENTPGKGKTNEKHHQPEQHESLGPLGEVLSSTAKNRGMGKGRLKCRIGNVFIWNTKKAQFPEDWNWDQQYIQKAGQCSHPWFLSLAEPMLKTVLHHFRGFEEPSFYLMSAKIEVVFVWTATENCPKISAKSFHS